MLNPEGVRFRDNAGTFVAVSHDILEGRAEPETTVTVVRLVQRVNQQYAELCRARYYESRALVDVMSREELCRVEAYQRERIQIDVIYHHPDNQELIDEYNRILASCAGSTINPSARARLMRIRTLSLRNEVPVAIFDTLEEIVLQNPHVAVAKEDEPDYIQTTREILGNFLLGKGITRR